MPNHEDDPDAPGAAEPREHRLELRLRALHYRLETTVPPGGSLVGFYPLVLFRFDRVTLGTCPGVGVYAGGTSAPCDGRSYTIESHQRTLCLGNFIALHVTNDAPEERPFDVTFHGVAIDPPADELAATAIRGFIPEMPVRGSAVLIDGIPPEKG